MNTKLGTTTWRAIILGFLCLLALGAAETPAAAKKLEIKVLSNRADLLSGGDALVRIVLPKGAKLRTLRVAAGGRDVTSSFVTRSGRRVTGLVTGLREGRTPLTARLPGARGARLVLVNHALTGPIFSGPQTENWRCDTEAQFLGPSEPPHCMAPTVVQFFYRSTSPQPGFQPYDPQNPPTDVASVTTDEGKTVPFVVRQEIGTLNRATYAFAVLWDPAREVAPAQPRAAWNGKLLFAFGGGAAMSHRQGTVGVIRGPSGDPGIDQPDVLARGFAIAQQSLGTGAININDVTSAETTMMVKERIVETLGPIRYTIGQGCSGGSINQSLISAAYPGLLDGTQPNCSFQDWFTTGMESADCQLLVDYFNETSPLLWGNPVQRMVVAGHLSPTTCVAHVDPVFDLSRYWWDPSFGCQPFTASAPRPPEEEWVYRPQDNPGGTRCTLMDDMKSVFGQRPQQRWGPAEQRIGRGFAPRPLDNVGVQYGLKPFLANEITAEQFVDLNEKIGGFDIDYNHVPERMQADPEALEIAYRTGRITSGNNWAKIPIIDGGSFGNNEIHEDVRSHIIRARLQKANGGDGNHAIWKMAVGGATPGAGLEAQKQQLDTIDRWLAAIEADRSETSLPRKVVKHRPADAVDKCFVGSGELSEDQGVCRTVYPYGGTPRMAAGGPLAEDVFKCQLRPVLRDDYNGVIPAMTNAQFDRLKQAFPDGVCDFSKPGVGYTENVGWMSFAEGPGGRPLGKAPRSRGLRGKPARPACTVGRCGGLRSFALSRAVFTAKALRIIVRLARPAKRLRVDARVGRRIVKRFAVPEATVGRTYRFLLPARLVPRGRSVSVRARAGRSGKGVVLRARRR